ncbi:MAG: molybdenum cofactor guanylyltransferase [Promethearchaeota archaeon]
MDFYVAILAGGKSNRFGSNKALFKIDGISLISKFLLEIPKLDIKPKVMYISLHSARQIPDIINSIKKYVNITETDNRTYTFLNVREKYGKKKLIEIPIRFIFDTENGRFKNAWGAIFGLRAVFREISDGFVQIAPCYTPYFGAKTINTLISEYKKNGWKWDALVPRWKSGYIEPLNSLFRAESFISIIEKNLNRNNLKISEIFNGKTNIDIKYFNIEENFSKVDPTLKIFKNINKLEDIL